MSNERSVIIEVRHEMRGEIIMLSLCRGRVRNSFVMASRWRWQMPHETMKLYTTPYLEQPRTPKHETLNPQLPKTPKQTRSLNKPSCPAPTLAPGIRRVTPSGTPLSRHAVGTRPVKFWNTRQRKRVADRTTDRRRRVFWHCSWCLLRESLGHLRAEALAFIPGGHRSHHRRCDKRILNRYVRWNSDGERSWIEYEPDPRHAELIVTSSSLGNAKGLTTLSVKKRVEEVLATLQQLDASQTRLYRSVVMTAAYLSQDRPDLSFSAKEVAIETCRNRPNSR